MKKKDIEKVKNGTKKTFWKYIEKFKVIGLQEKE